MQSVGSPPAKALKSWRAVSLFGLLACLGTGLAAKASVFGTDQRVPLPQSLQQAGAKLGVFFDSKSHSVCTAFCIAPDLVAASNGANHRGRKNSFQWLTQFLLRNIVAAT